MKSYQRPGASAKDRLWMEFGELLYLCNEIMMAGDKVPPTKLAELAELCRALKGRKQHGKA